MAASDRRRALAARLKQRKIVVAPGIHDGVAARTADRMGFENRWHTGTGVAD